MAMHASRSSSARVPSAKDRAATMPPTHSAAMARAVVRRAGFFFATLRSNMLTMALKTVSYARLTFFPLRATSLGRATIGHEFSTSSKCCRERYARTTCGPTSVDDRSTCTPSQQLFHSGSVKKQPRNLGVEIAFAFEIAVEAAVGEARTGHDLVERDTLKAMAIEELAGAVNDVFLDCSAVTSGVRHRASFCPGAEVCLERDYPFQKKIILNIFWRGALM